MHQKILLLFAIVIYSALLNAQSVLKPENTVLLIGNSEKEAVPEENSKTVFPKELKIPVVKFMPDLTWESILDVMNIKYVPDTGLILNKNFEFCKPYSLSLHNSLRSSDGHFLSYMEHYFTGVHPVFTDDKSPPDSVAAAYNRYFNDIRNLYSCVKNDYLTRIAKKERNKRYFYIIRDHLIDVSGKYDRSYRNQFSMKDLRKNVHHLSKTKFNASKVIIYTLPVKPVNGDSEFQKTFSHCEVLALQKKNTGPVLFYCFYTDEGYKNRKVYIKKLEKSVQFKK
jgi:hypothetical protein